MEVTPPTTKNQLGEVIGDGEASDDEDYEYNISSSEFVLDSTPLQPTKVAKLSQKHDHTTSRSSAHDCLRLEASPTDTSIYATFDVPNPSTINQDVLYKFLGSSIKYFTGFKQYDPSNPLIWRFDLSEKGLSRFYDSARLALARIGTSIVL